MLSVCVVAIVMGSDDPRNPLNHVVPAKYLRSLIIRHNSARLELGLTSFGLVHNDLAVRTMGRPNVERRSHIEFTMLSRNVRFDKNDVTIWTLERSLGFGIILLRWFCSVALRGSEGLINLSRE